MKKYILRYTKVFEVEIEAWSKEHAKQLLEDGYYAFHMYEMDCVKDEEKIISKRGA